MLDDEQVANALTVLTRLAQREPESERWLLSTLTANLPSLAEAAMDVALESGEPMGRTLVSALQEHPSPETAERLYERLPLNTVALLELALEVTSQLLAAQPAPAQETAEFGEWVKLLVDHAVRLVDLGRAQQGLEVAEQVLDLSRIHPGSVTPEPLARAHAIASECHVVLGDLEAATAEQEAALRIHRELAGGRRSVAVAGSLVNLAHRLDQSGRQTEALELYEQATQMFRDLLESAPRDLRLQVEDAVAAGSGPIRIWVEFGERPERLTPRDVVIDLLSGNKGQLRGGLADALLGQVDLLVELDRAWDALQAAEEAVAKLRDLTDAAPDTYGEALALTWLRLAETLEALGRVDEALKAAQEATSYFRTAEREHPGAFRQPLVHCLFCLAEISLRAGRIKEIHAVFGELLEAGARPYGELVSLDPLTAKFLELLLKLVLMLDSRGQLEEALVASTYYVEALRRLQTAQPPPLFELITALWHHLRLLMDTGSLEEALTAGEESVSHARRAIRTGLENGEKLLAVSLHNCSNQLSRAGKRREALAASAEAASLWAPYFLAAPAERPQVMTEMLDAYVGRAFEAHELEASEWLTRATTLLLAVVHGEQAPDTLGKIGNIAVLVGEASASVGDLNASSQVLGELEALARAHPTSRKLRLGHAMLSHDVVIRLIEGGELNAARDAVTRLGESTRAWHGDVEFQVQYAEAAWTLIGAYLRRGEDEDYEGMQEVARAAEESLRSQAYLAQRAQEFPQQSPDTFLAVLDAILAAPEDLLSE